MASVLEQGLKTAQGPYRTKIVDQERTGRVLRDARAGNERIERPVKSLGVVSCPLMVGSRVERAADTAPMPPQSEISTWTRREFLGGLQTTRPCISYALGQRS